MNCRLTTPALSKFKGFKIYSFASPICDCGVDSESVKHCSLYCPKYAAQRNVLLTSAASNMRHGLRAAMQGN